MFFCLCIVSTIVFCVSVSTSPQGYLKAARSGDDVVPVKIRERPEDMFGNIEDIFDLHSKWVQMALNGLQA